MLHELQEHLTDRHLHIIAPPGSGKTVLGLEVAIRLNKPTLVLAPTLAIRNQWIHRFCELFLHTQQVPGWISKDIRDPKFLTVVTYQGLHAACNNQDPEEETTEEEGEVEQNGSERTSQTHFGQIVNGLQSFPVGTIIADEAHHLKNEWWQTLSKVKESLDPVIVGLTATPPYDVSFTEWQRYLSLNGPVDTEISVPELVIENDLCPHQDYVYFSFPTKKESQAISEFRQNIETLFLEIRNDKTLIEAIMKHPLWLNPAEQLDWIYINLSCYSACLVFLSANGKNIPVTHLEIIGNETLKVPALDYSWMETLLDFYLYKEKEYFEEYEAHKKSLENRLRRYGAMERRQVSFTLNNRVTYHLTSSISKLNSISEIVDFEYTQLNAGLRMVILTDFIRKEYFTDTAENNTELNKIGVIPIFEKLRRENRAHKKLGVLTGSIIIIPRAAIPVLQAKAAAMGITEINLSDVPFDNGYVRVNPTGQLQHDIVQIITQIFQQGDIQVLIGTKSLLGEGWDAPAINSLVLASFVGSFVLSNQMRGRAIRTDMNNSSKTSNIWHLVCIDPTSATGGSDFDLLKRRFKSFVGVTYHSKPSIENGVQRLNLPYNIHISSEAEKKNAETLLLAGDRENLKQKWKEALASGVNLVEELKIPFNGEKEYKALQSMYYTKTIAHLFAMLFSGLVSYFAGVLKALGQSARNIKTPSDLLLMVSILGGVGVLVFGRQAYKALRLYLKYRDIAKDVKNIGDALVHSMSFAKVFHTDIANLKVEASADSQGAVYCHLEGGTTFEKSAFITALNEIISPIDNPRYVITRENKFMLFIRQRDYHAVPEVLAQNKEVAEYFRTQWQSFVGPCDLIFTRKIEGRKMLLQARMKSLAAQLYENTEHINKWR